MLDIRAKNDQGEISILEMQRGRFTTIEAYRFQFYPSLEMVNQIGSGENYSLLKRQVEIVVTPDKIGDELVNEYTFRKKNGNDYPNYLITIIIISLENLMVHENMSDQEIIAYVYKFGVDDDIMKLANDRQKGMIMHMEKKFESIIQSADYFTEAQEAALFEC